MSIRAIVVAALCLAAPALAAPRPVQDIRPLTSRPLAVRGGVLLLPLTAATPGDRWPSTLSLTLDDATTIVGDVVVMLPAITPRETIAIWTADPRHLVVRPIRPDDDTSAATDAPPTPYLVARLPGTGSGRLRLGRHVMTPVWIDAQITDLHGDRATPVPTGADVPDLDSPFEYWRAVLIADRDGVAPPPLEALDLTECERLVAEHSAALWRAARLRLERLSPGVAAQCIDRLTMTSSDHGVPFALWESDPAEIARLFATLFDQQRRDAVILESALAWADARPTVYAWVESQWGDHIVVALASASPVADVARFTWFRGDGIAIAVPIEPNRLVRAVLDRPPADPLAPIARGAPTPRDAPDLLRVETDSMIDVFTCRRAMVEARPPGVFFPTLAPPLDLHTLQSPSSVVLDPARATNVSLRRVHRRWEVMFECFRPQTPAPARPQTLASCRSLDHVRGIEAVTMLLGPESMDGGPDVALAVAESGESRLFVGSAAAGLDVATRSYADRWYCRIVLPEGWLPRFDTDSILVAPDPVLFGFIRSHGDGRIVETSPEPSLPWELRPSRAAVDLRHWHDTP
ncbi:MAG: hypothetical protein KDA25_00505 [Phycisphaerales bacterium]|nr:hypothetical protein [Phycisphaerales bacterium]